MLSCRDIVELAGRKPLDTLPWATRWQIRFHVLVCRMCRRYRTQIQLLDALLAAPPDFEHADLSSEARARILRQIETD